MGSQKQRNNLQESLDEGLTSALLAQDKELTRILQEVDNISKDLKSSSPDTQALNNALQRTVLCAIKQSLLDRELRSLALTDDLTCLYNRRAFYALANQQLKVARRRGNSLLLFFADVDHLKNINDTYGHMEGDLALVRAADALEQTFRNSDILARLSGDEFAVVALEASSEDRDAILLRLKHRIQKGERRRAALRVVHERGHGAIRSETRCIPRRPVVPGRPCHVRGKKKPSLEMGLPLLIPAVSKWRSPCLPSSNARTF